MNARRPLAGLDAAEVRRSLALKGGPFPDDLADVVPERFDVDVITTDLEGPGYLLSVGRRSVIVAAKTDSWFRQNFTIAHEIGHLAKDSLCDGRIHAKDGEEAGANGFAAELLLPADQVRAVNWESVALPVMAQQIWDWGVSTQTLVNRLATLGIGIGSGLQEELSRPTRGFLRRHLVKTPGSDVITLRSERSAARRFPTELVSRLEMAVSSGRVPVESLALALGIDPTQVETGRECPVQGQGDLESDLILLEGLD